jgi:hypothetical protein
VSRARNRHSRSAAEIREAEDKIRKAWSRDELDTDGVTMSMDLGGEIGLETEESADGDAG